MEQEEKRALEAYYESLPAEERRNRIILKPEFRDDYNELVEADRHFPVPSYLWAKWIPILGLFPVGVYLELRRMCFVNRATGERRDWCWPRQETLAKRLGVKKRHTVGKALEQLEARGFIKREPSYQKRGRDALVRRGADRYLVYFEIPLVPADAAELLHRRTSPVEHDGGSWGEGVGVDAGVVTPRNTTHSPDMAAKRPDRHGVEEIGCPSASDTAAKRPDAAGHETASRNVTRTITNNVPNVGISKEGERPDGDAAEGLALEIGECLSTWAGERRGQSHRSEGFHRLVARRMPERLLRQALMATRDAVERSRGGKGGCARGPAAYFAGVVKNLADENGIALGLRNRAARCAGEPRKAPERPVVRRSEGGRGSGEGAAQMSVGEARVALRSLVESIQAKKGM